jgi:pyruvate formate lyase activating enzyme
MENFDEETTGVVLEIQRMSTEDGPGLRTTVFLKGCSLRCEWCHNPESIAFTREIQWIGARCIGCGICRETCPSGALSLGGAEIRIARQLCRGCGECARQCPTGALESLGATRKAGELAAELEKDAAYFRAGGGGVTLSGGEAAMQPAFSGALLSILRTRGIHTALDTSGHCPEENLRGILPYVDLVLFDIKLIDPEEHRRLTDLTT